MAVDPLADDTRMVSDFLSAFASIIITTIVTMVSVGVQSQDPVEYHAFRQISFYEGFLAFANIMFGFSMSSLCFFANARLTFNLQLSMSPSLV